MSKIISHRSLGLQPCCDIEVMHPDHQFYLANGILTSNSAHAKAYGMVTMQTAYLRTYHPLEFFAAVLTCGQAGELQSYVDDIRRQGFKILPVDVNKSKVDHEMEGDGIRLSLRSVDGVGPAAIEKIIASQPYIDFLDFIDRSLVNKTCVEALVKCGAFCDLEPNIGLLLKRYELITANPKLKQKKMRGEFERQFFAIQDVPDLDPVEKMSIERELLGFNLRNSPFTINGRAEKIEKLTEAGLLRSYTEFIESENYDMDGNETGVIACVLKDFRERPQKNKEMFAFLKLTDVDGVEFEAPAFGYVWKHLSKFARKGETYLITFNHKEDAPTNLVVGKPGWVQRTADSLTYMLKIDEISG